MLAATYKKKKDLKASVGKRLRYVETSFQGSEYPKDGTGEFSVVGPSPYERRWYAEVHIKDHIIVKVS